MNSYTNLAKKTIENFVKTGKRINLPNDLKKEMIGNKAGVFVSIHQKNKPKKESLRGCIGTIEPTKKNIAQEIVENAIAACSKDLRFHPVREEELDNLKYSVDVLSSPELIKDKSLLNPKKYGVIIKSDDGKVGLLLPNLKGVDTADEQILIAKQKAGIMPEEKTELYRFEVMRHK